MKFRDFVIGGSLLALLASAAPAGPPEAPGHRVVRKVEVGGEGGWDYLTFDSASRRLYIPRSTRVMIFDADTLASVGEFSNANTKGIHGVAIAPELSRGFTSNGGSNTVTTFDTKTLKTIADVKVTGENPDAILYDPATKRVFAFNGRTSNATVIEAATGEVAGTIALDGKPEFAASDNAGRVFVNIEDKNIVTVDRREEADGREPLAAVTLRGADRPRHRPGAQAAVCWLPQQGHGGHGRDHRQDRRLGPDRRRCGRQRLRSGHESRLRLLR